MSARSLILAALTLPLFHCGVQQDDFSVDADGADLYDSWMDQLAVGQAPPPVDLEWYLPPMVFGETTEVLVTGGDPNKPALFVASSRVGDPGACPAAIAPECIGVPAPFTVLSTERFNANGEVTFTLRVPPSLPFNEVVVQVASMSGGQIFLTPALTKPIWDAPMDAEINDIRGGLAPQMSVVRTQGIVTARSGGGFFLQQPGQATFGGIYVFDGFASFKPEVGDEVSVIGSYEEFRSGNPADSLAEVVTPGSSYTVLSSNNPLPAPVSLTPAAWDDAMILESVESMMVVLEGAGGSPLTVTTDLGFGEFGLSDGGTTLGVVDDLRLDWMTDVPGWSVNDMVDSVTGPMFFSFDSYKVAPNGPADFAGWVDNP